MEANGGEPLALQCRKYNPIFPYPTTVFGRKYDRQYSIAQIKQTLIAHSSDNLLVFVGSVTSWTLACVSLLQCQHLQFCVIVPARFPCFALIPEGSIFNKTKKYHPLSIYSTVSVTDSPDGWLKFFLPFFVCRLS